MSDDLNWLSAREMARRFAKGDLSPVDVLEATLARLHAVNPALNAICLLDEPQGRRWRQSWRNAGVAVNRSGPLDGVPVAIKDTATCRGLADAHRLAFDGNDAERGGYARRRPPA